MTMLEIKGLEASYGHIRALRGIDLSIEAGEIVGLIGANGAGKTTLLRAISGLIAAQKGSVILEGRNLTGASPRAVVQAGIAHIPEGRHVWADMTVEENLTLGGSVARTEIPFAKRLESILSLFPELAGRLQQKAGTLSGGEQQMLAIGRGLASEPRMLMLDEPSLGLAPVIVQRVKEILTSLNKNGLTVLLSEQNARLALGATHRAYVLTEGTIVASGTPAELFKQADLISAYLGETPVST